MNVPWRRDAPFRWAGRRVIITGGSSGIGKQLAADLLRQGAHVGIVADDPDKLARAESDLKHIAPTVWARACDVAVLDDVRAMARDYRQTFDAPDVLINNAGYAVYHTFEQTSAEEIQRLFQVNLVGAALVTREFLPDLIRAGSGHVVMMASIAGRIPMTPCGVYSASKHGLVALAELLQIETARFHVRVHVVCPGRVETDFFAHESFRTRAHRPETAQDDSDRTGVTGGHRRSRAQSFHDVRASALSAARLAGRRSARGLQTSMASLDVVEGRRPLRAVEWQPG